MTQFIHNKKGLQILMIGQYEKDLLKRIIKTVGYRRNIDAQVTDSFKVPFVNQLYTNLVSVVNNYPFDNG